MDELANGATSGEIVWDEPRTNANDFNMINETTQDANNLELSLLYLQDSSTASSLIDQAANFSNDVTFDHVMQNGESYMNGSGVIWNPDIGFELDSGEIISPAGVLVAEFAHSVLPGGLDPNPTPDAVWNDSSEAIAHGAGNVVYAELGEPNRPDYFQGSFVDVPSVTSHGSPSDVFGDTIDTSASGGFDYGSFAADYGIDFGGDSFGGDSFGGDSFGGDSFGSDSGFDSYGSDSFGFDYGSFSSDYGIDFGGGGFDSFGDGGGGFDTDGLFEMMVSA